MLTSQTPRIEIVNTPSLLLQIVVDIAFIIAGLGAIASVYAYLWSGRRVKVHAEFEGDEIKITVGNKGRIDAYLYFVGIVILWRRHRWPWPAAQIPISDPVEIQGISMQSLVHVPPGFVYQWTVQWPDEVTFLKPVQAGGGHPDDRVGRETAKPYHPKFRAAAYSYRNRKSVRIKEIPRPKLRQRISNASLAMRGRL